MVFVTEIMIPGRQISEGQPLFFVSGLYLPRAVFPLKPSILEMHTECFTRFA